MRKRCPHLLISIMMIQEDVKAATDTSQDQMHEEMTTATTNRTDQEWAAAGNSETSAAHINHHVMDQQATVMEQAAAHEAVHHALALVQQEVDIVNQTIVKAEHNILIIEININPNTDNHTNEAPIDIGQRPTPPKLNPQKKTPVLITKKLLAQTMMTQKQRMIQVKKAIESNPTKSPTTEKTPQMHQPTPQAPHIE